MEGLLANDAVLRIVGRVALSEEGGAPEIIVENILRMAVSEQKYIGTRLFIRLKDENVEKIKCVKNILSKYPGGDDTVVYVEASKKKYVLGAPFGVSYNDDLKKELSLYLGADNVAFKQKKN